VICPRCGAEYRPGFTRCSDCLVELVDPAALTTPPLVPGPPALAEPVCVYRPTQRSRLALAESLLRSAGIPFAVAGEQMQQFLGLDVFGPAEIYVAAVDAPDARQLLVDLDR
jgi:hypothetical protein